ncbi:MAG: hypothetical protein HC828_22605, partial [Blastochloris sp.]|nr:hypothetical protein [Blastochloris sp.]
MKTLWRILGILALVGAMVVLVRLMRKPSWEQAFRVQPRQEPPRPVEQQTR